MQKYLIVLLIILIGLNNNSIEYLADENYSTACIMVYRSAISVFLFGALLFFKRKKIVVNNRYLLLLRSFFDGLGIFLIISSFKYLAAGTVSLIQRMDIPLLILLSVFKRESKSSLQFYLSLWAIVLIIFFVSESKLLSEDAIGYAFAIPAVFIASFTFFLIKKHTSQESIEILGFFYSFSLLVWGLSVALITQSSLSIHVKDIWIFMLGGIFQFSVVSSSLYLFQRTSSEKARLPFVLSIIGTMVIEMIIENKLFSFSQLALTAILTGIIATICLNPSAPIPQQKS